MGNKHFVPLAVTVMVTMLTLLIVRPTLIKVVAGQKENQKNKKILAQLIDKAEKLSSIDEVEMQKRVKSIEEVLPSEKPVMELINMLEQLSAEKDVIFSGIELRPGNIEEKDVKTKQRESLDISFIIEGKLANVSSFINDLEKTSPLMKIETMDLKFIGEREEKNLKTTLTVKVFYQSAPETISAIDQPLAMLTDEELETLKKISSYRSFPKIQPTAVVGKEDLFSLP